MADNPALKDKLSMLEDKLKRLESREMVCDYLDADGDERQQETIARTKKFIREVKRELAEGKPVKQLPRGAAIHDDSNGHRAKADAPVNPVIGGKP